MAEIQSSQLAKFIRKAFPDSVIKPRIWLELMSAGAMELISGNRFNPDMSSKNRLMLSLGDLVISMGETIVKLEIKPTGTISMKMNIPPDILTPFLHLMSPRLIITFRGSSEVIIGHDPIPRSKVTFVKLSDLSLSISMRDWLTRNKDSIQALVLGSDKTIRPVSSWRQERNIVTQINLGTGEFQMSKS